MPDQRRFDLIEKVVADERRRMDDFTATVMARLAKAGVAVVLSTVEILTPYAGQLAVNATDNMLYEYDGASWVGCVALGGSLASQRHDCRYEATAVQAIASSTDTKVRFPTPADVSNDVTPSGTGNQDFLMNRGGLWRFSTSLRLAATGADDETLFLSTGTAVGTITNRFAMQGESIEGSSEMTMSISTDIRLAAGTSVFVGIWQNSGASVNTHGSFGRTNHFAATWMRP